SMTVTVNAAIVIPPVTLPVPQLNLPSILPLNSEISINYPSGYSIDHFEWAFTPQNLGIVGSPANNFAPAGGAITWFSSEAATNLTLQPLRVGTYLVSVIAVDTKGNRSNPGLATVSLVESNLDGVQVYPNPWRKDKHDGHPITFDHLSGNV